MFPKIVVAGVAVTLALVMTPKRARAEQPPGGGDRQVQESEEKDSRAAEMTEREVELRKWRLEVIATVGGMSGRSAKRDVPYKRISGVSLGVGVAVRKHYHRILGLQARASVAAASQALHYDDEDPGISRSRLGVMPLYMVDVTHVFGPFLGFYLGPNVFVLHARYPDDASQITTAYGEPLGVTLGNITMVGGGLDMGLLLGRRDQFHLNARVQAAPDGIHLPFMRTDFGFGWIF